MHRTRSGFTLVELMIVVAIIGILASIAIPNFVEMQYRAKRSEPMINLSGIATAETAYEAANDAFVECENNPGAPLTKKQNTWDTTLSGWSDLGWLPDGAVRCNYKVSVFGSGSWFRADATCDMDNDNSSAIIRYYSEESGQEGFSDLYPTRF